MVHGSVEKKFALRGDCKTKCIVDENSLQTGQNLDPKSATSRTKSGIICVNKGGFIMPTAFERAQTKMQICPQALPWAFHIVCI